MKKKILFLIAMLLLLGATQAQVTVTGSTGADGSYARLGLAFTAINGQPNQAGRNITISITANTTETASAVLNQPASASWTSLTIVPAGGAARTISGTLAVPLIDLNGADNVIIDGLNTGGNSLTISNLSTVTTAGTSTIRFIGDATNNIIRNTTIEGSGTGTATSTIFFSTGLVTGNDNNTITNSVIRPAGANLPTNAIRSAGTSVAIDNNNNHITNNHIQDYFNPGAASNGIFLASNSSAWIISGNRFFQTAPRTFTATVNHEAIQITTPSGVGYLIINNIIGFANALGTYVTTYGGTAAHNFRAIEVTVGTASTSFIQGNDIAGITITTASGLTTLPGIFSGISVLGGRVEIDNNTIGSTAEASSITITSTTNGGVITGIYATSTVPAIIQNNRVGGIGTGGTAAIGYTFHGIRTAGAGHLIIRSNMIGSANIVNSIRIGTSGVTTTGVCTFNAINNTATEGITIDQNTVQNVSVFGTGASVFYGILNSGATGIVTIADNRIIAANNTGTGAFTGISNSAAALTVRLNNNILRNHTIGSGAFTGITNRGSISSRLEMNHNQLGNAIGGLLRVTVASAAAFTGISNLTGVMPSAILEIIGNDFRGITHDVAVSGAHTFISNTIVTLEQHINNNTFTNLLVNTTGHVNFIANNVAVPATGIQNVNNNSIIGSFAKTGAGNTLTLFSSTAASAAGAVVNNNNNNFSNITVTGATFIAGWVNTDAGLATKTIRGNTFSHWTGGTQTITALHVGIAGRNNTISENQIHNISGGYHITGISSGAGYDNIFGNTIHNLFANFVESISARVSGIAITAGTDKNVFQNTIFNLGGDANRNGSVNGINITGGTKTNAEQNTIHTLQANALTTGTINGIAVSAGGVVNLSRNKINNLSSSSSGITGAGAINGILVSGAVASMGTTIANNLIGDLRATSATAMNLIRGVAITSTGINSNINLYYNTIFLSAPSIPGANHSTSGVFHTASNTATTAKLDMRNNIIVNTSEFHGSGNAVAFRRSAGTAGMLANYASTSNNNLFYAGTPAANRLIYADGTSTAQTIAAFRAGAFTAGTIAPRDAVSVSERPNWLSTVGSDANFLNINPAISNQIESRGVNIPGITNDFAGNIRHGNPGYFGSGTAPDIGAFEIELLPFKFWSGSVSTSWPEANNWIGGVLPTAYSFTIIRNEATQPILSAPVTVQSLTIADGASLEIAAAGQLTVSGTLTNQAGNAGLVLRSGASLIHNTANVPATMQRFFPGSRNWRMVSSPVANQAIAGSWTPATPNHGYDFFAWSEPTSTWLNQKVAGNNITHFVPGRGYLVSFEGSNLTQAFEGALNFGNIVQPFTRRGAGIHIGANLLGNPYPSAIDWRAASRGDFIDNFAYVYDANRAGGAGYVTIDGASSTAALIAPNQGFFVLADRDGNFTFTNAMRTHGGVFKAAPVQENMVVRLSHGQFFDETTMRISEQSQWMRDRYDAAKFFSFSSEVPQLFSQSANQYWLAINSVPYLLPDSEYILGLRAPGTGQYTLSLQSVSGAFATGDVFVRDLVTGMVHNISHNGEFTFTASAGEHAARFKVIFTTPTTVGNLPQGTTAIYAHNRVLHLNFATDESNRQLQVFDISGRLVLGHRLPHGTSHSMPLNIEPGTYIVRITDSRGVTTQRVMVR
jgi:hypothetical protein